MIWRIVTPKIKPYNGIYQKNYDQVSLRVPKGRREKIQMYAEEQGKSLNGYIVDLIQEDMEKVGHSLE